MSTTVYLHFQPIGKEDKKSKIVIPKSWTTTKTVENVIELYAKSFNSKNPDDAITVSNFHLETSENEKIYSNAICGTVLGDHSDYYIRPGAYDSVKKQTSSDGLSANSLRCKNYGCQKYYTEDENSENSCQHHVSPPIFHDTSKYWSCCPDRKAYDFESFQQIQGCV